MATAVPGRPQHTGRPLRADAERNRRRLLAAAREAFAEHGLEVTMDEIARRAGVGVGTAYRRFSSRDELIDALFEERLEQFAALAADALRDPDPWHGLSTFLERSIAMQVADRGLHELLHSRPEHRERIARARDACIPLVEQLVERARLAGELRSDIAMTDVALVSLMIGAVAAYAQEVAPELWRRYLAIVLDGLRARRAGPTELPVGPLDHAALEVASLCRRSRRR